ncbi:MAG: hypothetical protein NZ700_08185 [Gemmataceae bacterium]|nr:hypothetical protein [Gemmataceae bacterium]MDW8264384.1 hypothetical protein [Gemmataceae bacterium]
MRFRSGLAWTVLLVGGLAPAQEAPERLFSADTQIYFRWDGTATQRAAFEKTALHKVVFEEFGPLFDSLTAKLTRDKHTQLFRKLAEQGCALGVEFRNVSPLEFETILVLPQASQHAEALFELLRQAIERAGLEADKFQSGGREVHYAEKEGLYLAWWADGKDLVLSLSTDAPKTMLSRLSKRPGLDQNPHFRQLQEYREFATTARGYADIPALLKLAEQLQPEMPKAIEILGLRDLKTYQFHMGFDGPALRTVAIFDAPGPRKGLLKLLSGKPFTLADLPRLPPEITSFDATSLDLGLLYDIVLDLVGQLAPPPEVEQLRQQISDINRALGIDLRSDLLGSLGSRIVSYHSKSAISLLGMTILLEIKDEAKLRQAVTQLTRGCEKLSDGKVRVRTSTYRNVPLHSLYVEQEEFPFTPTFALHQGWLVVGLYPQTVQDFILRQKGELPAWVPDAAMKQALNRAPKAFTAVSVSDPRPGVLTLWGLAPIAGAMVANNFPQLEFDVGLIPHSYAVARHLFPTVSVTTDDGKTIRLQNWTAVPVLDLLAESDTMMLWLMMASTSMLGRSVGGTFEVIEDRVGGVPAVPPPPPPPPKDRR